MNSAIQEGRTQVIAIIIAVIFSLLLHRVIVMRDPAYPQSSSSDIIRIGVHGTLTIVLCYFLYQGHGWAKWGLGLLLAAYSFLTIPVALIGIFSSVISSAWILIPLVIDLIASLVLLGSPQIKAFLSSQRAERSR